MGRTACTEAQCLYKGTLYLSSFYSNMPGITLYFLQTIAISPTVHASSNTKPSFITNQKECALDLSSIHSIKAPVRKIRICSTISVMRFMKIFLLYVRKKFSCSFAFYADYADTPVCLASRGKNFLSDVFNIIQISPCFSPLRMWFLCDL